MAGTTVPAGEGGYTSLPASATTQERMRYLEDQEELHQGIGTNAIYVWQLPVRLTHWAIVISIVILAVTGAYIHGPFMVPSSPIEASTLMAQIRFIHELSAIVFTIAIGVRFYWGFVGNQYANWRAIIPHNRSQFRCMREMGKYYLFLRSAPVPMTGHNLLAGLAYTLISAVLFFQVATGMILFGWLIDTGPAAWLTTVVAWIPGNIQTVRMLHFLSTFIFIAFMIHHVYSAILVDIEERNGVMTSIFTGFKNIRPESTVDDLGLCNPPNDAQVPASGADVPKA